MKTKSINHKKYFPNYTEIKRVGVLGTTLFVSILCIMSCKKFLEIPPPTTQLVTASVFNNDAAASSAVTDIYTQMFKYDLSYDMANDNGLLADELQNHSTASQGAVFAYFTNGMTNSQAVYGDWQVYYNYSIYSANAVIAGLKQYSGTSPAVKQQLMGEAYFIRAFCYFNLTNCYGAVPLALTTDYTINEKLARTPRVQVLQQVISDLQTAQGMLRTNYVDASDTLTTTDRVRPTKAVAAALLARAYLYLGDYNQNNTGDYQAAIAASSSVISNSTYSLCANLSGANSVFLKNSTEAIWQLYTPLPASYDTYDGNQFVLLAAANINQSTISRQLLNAFETGDKRQTNWIGTLTINGTTYFFPYKYKNNTYKGQEYTMMLRLAEQYLIRAEAEAELGQTANAVADLNVIRNRAGLSNYAGATDKASLLTAIQHERQVELFTEWGHRWFDLNRAVNTASTINVNTVLGSPGNVCQTKGGIWSSDGHQQLYPIPISDIQKDPNLTQNPGY